jgi:hypothetical protein
MLLLVFPRLALAQADGSPCERFGTHPAVFVGEAGRSGFHLMKSPDSPAIRMPVVPMVVESAFRGTTAGTTVYLYPADLLAAEAVAGRRYLVFGWFNFGGVTDVVTPSSLKPVEDSSEDLDFLSNRDVLLSSTGRVYGTLVHGIQPLAGVTIHFRTQNFVTETATDEQGRYDVSGLPEGFVRAEPVLPDRLAFGPGSIEVRSGGCTPNAIVVQWNGRIGGRVLRPDLKPMTSTVDLLPANPRRTLLHDGRSVRANGNGEYEFTNIPPGEYVVGINLRRQPQPGFPFPPSYAPGTTRREDALTVSVGEGTLHTGIDFVVPETLKRGQLEVRVVSAAGMVSVCLASGSTSGATYPQKAAGEPIHVDVVEGSPHQLWAHVEGSAGHTETATVSLIAGHGQRVVSLSADRPGREHLPGSPCGPYRGTP